MTDPVKRYLGDDVYDGVWHAGKMFVLATDYDALLAESEKLRPMVLEIAEETCDCIVPGTFLCRECKARSALGLPPQPRGW